MRRAVPILVLLMVGACAAQPPERAPLPDVAEAVPEPLGCLLSVGEPMGVSVLSVIDPSAAVGVLEEGDIITSINDAPTQTRPDLTEVMLDYAPGESAEVAIVREGNPQTATLTFGANPDDENRAMIGITVETAFEQIAPDAATQVVTPSGTARPIEVGGSLYILDPVTNAWQKTGIVPPEEKRWASTSSGLFSVTAIEPFAILDLMTGDPVEDDGFRDWVPQNVLGAVGDTLIVFLTAPIADQPGLVNLAIGGFDPLAGTTQWVTPLGAETFGIPTAAFGSADATAFVAVGVAANTGDVVGLDLFDAAGVAQNRTGLDGLGNPMGWFNETAMSFRTDAETISTFDFIDGSIETYTLPDSLVGSVAAAVGDGEHILVVGNRDLMLQGLLDPNFSAPLASNCNIGRTGDPGWGL